MCSSCLLFNIHGVFARLFLSLASEEVFPGSNSGRRNGRETEKKEKARNEELEWRIVACHHL